jgi:4-carboxymuconolactone decarboxylase
LVGQVACLSEQRSDDVSGRDRAQVLDWHSNLKSIEDAPGNLFNRNGDIMDTSKYDETDGFKQGLQVRREVIGDEYVKFALESASDDPFSHDLQQFSTEHCWGTIWCRPGLDRRARSIICLTLLAAFGRTHEMKLHIPAAINNGLTRDEIKEIFLQTGIYAGMPAALEGFRVGRDVFAQMDAT